MSVCEVPSSRGVVSDNVVFLALEKALVLSSSPCSCVGRFGGVIYAESVGYHKADREAKRTSTDLLCDMRAG